MPPRQHPPLNIGRPRFLFALRGNPTAEALDGGWLVSE
jgi:hypothetical protein